MVLNKQSAVGHITQRVENLYQELSQGKPVSLTQRLYLEGQINLFMDYEVIDFSWLKSLINQEYEKWLGEPVSPAMWQWMKDDGCFYLPIKMHEAPVYRAANSS
jgi:hypothetical protein